MPGNKIGIMAENRTQLSDNYRNYEDACLQL